LLVLTNADLYPKDGWTFVFGMTKCSWRICIQSYARHHPNFAKQTDQPQRIFDTELSKIV
jgi:predicted Zn-dependent protease